MRFLAHGDKANRSLIAFSTATQDRISAEIEKMLDELKLLHQEIAGVMIDKRV